MSCEQYKDALNETAAGVAASSALRAHLIVCAECRDALAAEVALFVSIDAHVRAAANTEIPPTLLPALRARLVDESPRKNLWPVPIIVPLAAALVFAVFLLHGFRRSTVQMHRAVNPQSTTSAAESPGVPGHPSGDSAAHANPRAANAFIIAKAIRPRIAPAPAGRTRVAERFPEILVPPDQEALVVRYAEEWRTRKYVRLSAALFPRAPMDPMELRPIQIDALDVQSLAELVSQ